jgi:hypothetical protein
MRTTTLKPGLLVSLKTKIVGGVQYHREDLTPPSDAPAGADTKRWETTRTVIEPEAWERARVARTAAQAIVRRACIKSDFGLLCLASSADNLIESVEEAQRIAAAFNATTTGISVEVYAISARIADDDEQAMRAITSEVRGLLEEMNAGIAAADPDAIRAAASRARSVGALLDDQGAGHVKRAIAEAREVAKAIVKRVQDGGEEAAKVVGEFQLDQLRAARFAFLDIDDHGAAPATDQLPATSVARAAGLDIPDAAAAAPQAHQEPAQRPAPDLDTSPATVNTTAPPVQREIDF